MIGPRSASLNVVGRTILSAVFVGFLLLALTAPAVQMTTLFPQEPAKLVRQLGYPLLLLLGIAALRPWRNRDALWVVAWPLILLLGWCAFSLSWSAVPGVGLRQLVLTACAVMIPFLCVRHLGTARSLLLLRIVLLVALLVNFAVVILYPAFGTHDYGIVWSKGQWRGAMGHKNGAGIFAALTLLTFLFDPRGLLAALRYAVVAAAAVFLFFTNSRTALATVPIAAAVGGLLILFHARIAHALGRHRRDFLYAGLTLCGVVVAALLFFTVNEDALFGLMNDPAALSNRVAIWQPLLRFYVDHPFAGAGFGSFWDTQQQADVQNYGGSWLSDIAQGHNGYFELLVQVGLPGLLLALAAVIVWPVKVLAQQLSAAPATCALAAAILVFCIGDNLTETSMFSRDTLGHVFLMIALAMLAAVRAETAVRRQGGERRSRRRSGHRHSRQPA